MADEFAQFGGSAVADAPDEFAQFGGQTGAASNPSAQGPDYTTSATVRDLGSLKDAAFGNDATPDYQADEGGAERFLRQTPVVSQLGGTLLANIGHGIGNLASSAYDTLQQAKDTATADRIQNGPLLATAHLAGAAGLGIPGAIYGTINPVANLIEKGVTDIGSDALRLTGNSDAGANFEKRQNADRLQYRQDYEQPAQQAILNASPNPAVTEGVQNVAPLLIPGGVGLESAGIAARTGSAIGDLAEGGINLVGEGAKYASPAVGLAKGVALGGPAGGYFGLKSGLRLGDVISAAAPKVASAVGGTVGDLSTLGINAAAPAATGAILGLGSADPGQEVESARAGLAQGALFSPVSALHGTFARQDMEQSGLAKQSAIRGMQEYGNNPDLDAATARGIATLDPASQQAIFEQRGIYRGIKNPEGNQIQIHVPDNYAEGAAAANGGTVDDAANSRGYYLDGKGGVFINPEAADTTGALQEALGHEVGHSVYQDALPGVNERAANRLTNAVTNQALDANLQPTPQFQSFIDQYATAANGKPSTVDWNSLPVSGAEGLTRTKLINELGAETVRAATPGAGKQLAGREFSDVAGDYASDLATRLGLKQAPDAAAILGPNGQPVPIGVSALQAARKGTYAIGQQARAGFDSPVRIAEPEKVPAPTQPPLSRSSTETQTQSPVYTNQTSPSAQPDTSFRQTQAYQDALALATQSKKAAGLGLKPADAQAFLDKAAQDPNVPDTLTDYVGYISRAQSAAKAPTAPAPNIAPVQPVPVDNVPVLAPTAPMGIPSSTTQLSLGAKRIYLPAPVGKLIDPATVGPNIRRIELPSVEPATPALTLPKVEPTAKRILLPVKPLPAQGEVPANRMATDEPLATGPTDQESASRQASDQYTPVEADSQPTNPAPAATESQSQDKAVPLGDSTPDTGTTASPLSSEDIARIESETESAHQPNPYPRSSPESRAQKQAADLAKAKADAVAKAHSDALAPEDDRVRATVDPDTGTVKLSGKRFVEGDAFHDQLLRNATDGEKANLSTVQDAIGNGQALNFDYDSALPLRGEDTNAQRKESQALSTASDREQGVGLAQEANHTFIPLSASPTASGHAQVYGYAPDKVLGNAETAIRLMRDSGLSDRLPYTGINDPSLTADIRAYTENHVNGYKGDGSAKLQATEGVSVPQGDPNYTPQPLPPAKAHFINLIMGQDDTLSQKQAVKTGPNAGKPTNSATLRNFAAANDNVPSASGEVNPLRDELNRKGVLKVGNDKGSGEVLHSAFENIKPGLITRFHDQPGASEVPPLRASSFEGDRGSIAPGGKTPNRQFAAASFLPAREAGATPEQAADAAKQWREKGTDSPYFKSWFGDSKIVDNQGNPLIVNHGTPTPNLTEFSRDRLGTNTQSAESKIGFFFTPNYDLANSDHLVGRKAGAQTGEVKQTYLSIKNPLLISDTNEMLGQGLMKYMRNTYGIDPRGPGAADKLAGMIRDKLQELGYDGVMHDAPASKQSEIIALHPEQIKSANNNNGQFNPKDPRISFLPAREAGAGTPEQKLGILPSIVRSGENIPGTTGRAAEDLPVQRFGNATVTGAGTQFLPAYHGTPHEVDRFDSSKIGTGEGAQVFGHGLYFAENREVAEQYRKNLSENSIQWNEDQKAINAALNHFPNDPAAAKDWFQSQTRNGYAGGEAKRARILRSWQAHADEIQRVKSAAGNTYSVDLNVHPDRLMDWDKPLNEQSETVKIALGPLVKTHILDNENFINAPLKRSVAAGDIPASKLYRLLGGEISLADGSQIDPPKAASNALNAAGVHGIKYLDQGSRGSGEGSSNYVVFDDSKIRITHRNDLPAK